jgi:two-component system cell cycle response regulator CpdR
MFANIFKLFRFVLFIEYKMAGTGKFMSPRLIILFEKDINLRQSIALILQRAGYTVVAIDCADKALELLHTGNYHLLISDISTHETYDQLLSKAHKIDPNLPIMILTDQSIAEIERENEITGAHYLLKPVAPERLLDFVQTILNNRNNSSSSTNPSNPVDQ